MSKTKRSLFVLGIFVMLSGAIIPLSSSKATMVSNGDEIKIGIGIAKMIGIEAISNVPGTDVDFSDGYYSKTMVNGESLENFGATTFNIICNFSSNDDPKFQNGYNCEDNGWVLTASSPDVLTEGGTPYAAMVDANSSAAILSKMTTFSVENSTWAFKFSPIAREIDGVDVSPIVTTGYDAFHTIPTSSTEVASGKSWQTIKDVKTYIDGFGVKVQYGIGVADTQAAGTYVGTINYTVSLKAST